jgi:hypothetical protein
MPVIVTALACRRQGVRFGSFVLVTRGADDGIRTRDPHLGKVVLYQLSHVRVRSEEHH